MLDAVFLANLGSSYFVPATSHALDIRLCHVVDKKTTVKSCTSFKFYVLTSVKNKKNLLLNIKVEFGCILFRYKVFYGTRSFYVISLNCIISNAITLIKIFHYFNILTF